MILLALALACEFSAPSDVLVTDTADPGPDTPGEDGGGEEEDEEDEEVDPLTVDDDGDGFSEEEGDCDDTTATISPDAADGCDGIDEDCDGEVDEDAADDDGYEPNGAGDDPADLGSVNEDPVQAIQAALHNDGDLDRYRFTFEDGTWDWGFTINVALSGIPDGARYGLSLEHVSSGEVIYDEVGSDELLAQVEESWFYEDGGEYEISVWAEAGADCGRRYLLSIELLD